MSNNDVDVLKEKVLSAGVQSALSTNLISPRWNSGTWLSPETLKDRGCGEPRSQLMNGKGKKMGCGKIMCVVVVIVMVPGCLMPALPDRDDGAVMP